ncbi:MAG: hypothetical protein KDC42_10920 [Ignavibacteriae bacterium]|nr:hypothetical protein [Ignavibacteriota bacterium]
MDKIINGDIGDPSGRKLPDLNFIEFYKVFWNNRLKIIIPAVIVCIIAAIFVFFIVKPVFLSEGTVKTSTNESGLGALLGAGGIPDVGDLGELAGGGSEKELALYENIIKSRRCIEETIIKFNLNGDWDFKYMEDAVKHFKEEVLVIDKDRISGLITVGAYNEDPLKAKEIVDFLIAQLIKINTELNVQSAKSNREFIEKRFNIVKVDLKKAEDSLKVFQNQFGIAPDLTVQAAVKTQIEIEAEIASEEVKLDLLRKILSPSQSEIKIQEEKIASLKNQLNLIENSSGNENILGLEGKPQVVMDYLRLKRDVEIQNKILSFILPLYEQAKIEENKEIPPVVVLDPPNIPERKSKPKRIQTILIFTLIAFVLAYLWFFFKNRYKMFKSLITDNHN